MRISHWICGYFQDCSFNFCQKRLCLDLKPNKENIHQNKFVLLAISKHWSGQKKQRKEKRGKKKKSQHSHHSFLVQDVLHQFDIYITSSCGMLANWTGTSLSQEMKCQSVISGPFSILKEHGMAPGNWTVLKGLGLLVAPDKNMGYLCFLATLSPKYLHLLPSGEVFFLMLSFRRLWGSFSFQK